MVQRYGLFRIISGLVRKLASNQAWQAMSEHGEKLDEHVRDAYTRKPGMWASFFWSCMNWVTGVGEVWIALLALGYSASFGKAWMVESIQQAVRAAAFLVPGGLGVQEESYLMLGNVIGLPSEASLALALIRRVRELSFGIPGLIAWQFTEGRRLFRSREVQPTSEVADRLSETEVSERIS
jgi:putative membrane protein